MPRYTPFQIRQSLVDAKRKSWRPSNWLLAWIVLVATLLVLVIGGWMMWTETP